MHDSEYTSDIWIKEIHLKAVNANGSPHVNVTDAKPEVEAALEAKLKGTLDCFRYPGTPGIVFRTPLGQEMLTAIEIERIIARELLAMGHPQHL